MKWQKTGTFISLLANFLNIERFYNTVNDMINDENLSNGVVCKTLGYYNKYDNGNSLYYIVNDESLEDDGGNIITLKNGLKAHLIIINNTLNVAQFGIFESNEDNTDKLNKLGKFLENGNINILNFNNETYKISNIVDFNLNNNKLFTINFNKATILLTSSFRYFLKGIFTLTFDMNKNSILNINNGIFKGDGNPPDFSSTNINPNGGRGMFFIDGARFFNADNCYFENWFYSACFWLHYVVNAKITNCIGLNVGGRSADNSEDARGDALYFGFCGIYYVYDKNGFIKYLDEENNVYWYDEKQNIVYNYNYSISPKTLDELSLDIKTNSLESNILIENCIFKSYEACENMYSSLNNIRNGCKSGRCGVVFAEYSLTGKQKNLSIINTTFYNYQRTIHIENVDEANLICQNVNFEEFGSAILTDHLTHWNSILCENCLFKKELNIIGISPDYDAIISASPQDKENQLKFNNCRFIGNNIKLALHMNSTKIYIINSYIEVEFLSSLNNCDIIFKNCTIKFNRTNLFKTTLKILNCNVYGGYLNNDNSNCYFGANDVSATELKNPEIIFENSILNNVNTFLTKNAKLIMINNIFNYDENYKLINTVGTSQTFIFSQYGFDISKIIGNTFNNTNTQLKNLVDPSFRPNDNTILNIINNTINNLRFYTYSAYSQGNVTKKFFINIFNNIFNNTNNNNTNALELNGDNFGNMINSLVSNNIFNGYDTPLTLQSNVVKMNNYNITDNGMDEL